MPITRPPVDVPAVDIFCDYFRSLKLFNYIKNLIPHYLLKGGSSGNVQEKQRQQLIDRAIGTTLNPERYRELVSEYMAGQATEQGVKFDWRDIEKLRSSPPKPNPLREFVSSHVDTLYARLATMPSGIEKSWAAVRGVVKSGFEGYDDDVYEAYSLLLEEVPKAEIQAIITSWQSQRNRFQDNLQYPSGITTSKIFWPASAARFVEEGVARYRFKCDFDIGGFESAFVEFEESLAESLSSAIAGDGVRSLAYDLCLISRSPDLVNKLRPSLASGLGALISQRTGPYWSEWSLDDDKIPKKIPSVATTSFAALALLKLASSDSIRAKGIEAAAWLIERQNLDGSWSLDSGGEYSVDLKPDIHVTLTTMESIARSGISGASHHLDLGRSWLLSRQDKNGFWEDKVFSLPQPSIFVIETFDYLNKMAPRAIDTYLAAAIGYFGKARLLLGEQDTTARRLAVVTAHLGIESFLYSLIQTNNITKFIDKGQTIGMRAALIVFQSWMQQQRHLKPNELLSFSNELGKLAHLRDEIVHKALSIGTEDAGSVVRASAAFASKYSLEVLGFDCFH